MTDLRTLRSELLKQKISKAQTIRRYGDDGKYILAWHEYTIEEVYPYIVRCRTECENGYVYYESFNLGDLIIMGIIIGKGKKFVKNEKGRREGYGHTGK